MSGLSGERFFLPGPTEVHPDVAAAMLRPMIGHRGAEFRTLFARLQEGVQYVFQTTRPVVIATSSSTGLMEMAIRSAPAGRVLTMVNGGFSERFDEIARACGRDVVRLDAEWGRAHELAAVEAALQRERIAAVAVVQSETSTGVLTDVRDVTRMAHRHGAVALIDSVSLLGGGVCPTDAWEMDFVLAGSQKAIAIPPGLAFASATGALVEGSRQNAGRGMYFDLADYIDSGAKHETPSTPSLPLLYALDQQLTRIKAETMEGRIARHEAMAAAVHTWAEQGPGAALGVNVLAPRGNRCPTVSVLTLPGGIETAHVLHAMRTRGFTIAAGYGPLSSGSVRIGHMGDHTVTGVQGCLDALEDAISSLKRRGA